MNLEHAAALTSCRVVLVLPGWSLWRMVKGLCAGDWRRPAWLGHATWASLVLMVPAWLWGLAARPANKIDHPRNVYLRERDLVTPWTMHSHPHSEPTASKTPSPA